MASIFKTGPRFFVFGVSLAFARQTDDHWSWRIRTGTEYFDIIRQSSERFKTRAFISTSSAGVDFYRRQDALSIDLLTRRFSFSIDNLVSAFTTAFHIRDDVLRAAWSSQWRNISGSIGAQLSLNSKSPRLLPFVSVGLAAFDSVVCFRTAVEIILPQHKNRIGLKDFTVGFVEDVEGEKYSAAVDLLLWDPVTVQAQGYSRFGRSLGSQSGYSVVQTFKDWEATGSLRLQFADAHPYEFGFSYGELEPPAELYRDAQLFSSLAKGFLRSRSLYMKTFPQFFHAPWRIRLDAARYEVSAVGHVESWPFTPLAASVFQNRLYFRGGGRANFYSTEVAVELRGFNLIWIPQATYAFLEADLAVEHWEPEFLVFGVKNFAQDPLGIERAHFLRIGLTASFSLFGLRWELGVSQIVPLAIVYQRSRALDVPGQPTLPSPPVRTDGGRMYTLRLFLENL